MPRRKRIGLVRSSKESLNYYYSCDIQLSVEYKMSEADDTSPPPSYDVACGYDSVDVGDGGSDCLQPAIDSFQMHQRTTTGQHKPKPQTGR